MSLGSRLVTNKRSPQTGEERCKGETITTTVINPIMGHLQTSFTAQLTNSIRAAARYDLNFYSGDSDVALGALIFNCTGDLIRLRCSWRHGLALSLTMANHPSSSHVNESKCIDLFKGQNLVDSKEKNIIGLMTRHAKESKTVQVNSKPDESKDPTRVKITLGLATGPLLIQSALEPESIPTPASFACRPSINLSVFLEH